MARINSHERTVTAGFITVVMQPQGSNDIAIQIPIFVQVCKKGIVLIDNVQTGKKKNGYDSLYFNLP